MRWIRGVLAVAACGAMVAFCFPVLAKGPGPGPNHEPPGQTRQAQNGTRNEIPELDPTAAGAFAALVAGGTVLLARRRRR